MWNLSFRHSSSFLVLWLNCSSFLPSFFVLQTNQTQIKNQSQEQTHKDPWQKKEKKNKNTEQTHKHPLDPNKKELQEQTYKDLRQKKKRRRIRTLTLETNPQIDPILRCRRCFSGFALLFLSLCCFCICLLWVAFAFLFFFFVFVSLDWFVLLVKTRVPRE